MGAPEICRRRAPDRPKYTKPRMAVRKFDRGATRTTTREIVWQIVLPLLHARRAETRSRWNEEMRAAASCAHKIIDTSVTLHQRRRGRPDAGSEIM